MISFDDAKRYLFRLLQVEGSHRRPDRPLTEVKPPQSFAGGRISAPIWSRSRRAATV